MPNSTNEETLAASQRLLDYISGQQKSAPTVAPAAPAADSRPPVSEKKPGRFAHPLKSLSEPFAHRTTPTIGLVYDSDGILLTRTHHLTIGELYLEKLRFVPYPAGTDATNLKESAACAVRALKSFAPDFARCRVWAMLAKAELSLLTLPPTKTEEERDAVALLKASQQTKYDAADLCFDYRLQENVVKGADVHAVGLMSSQKTLSDLVAAFKESGVTLAGVTSTKLSPAILLRPAFGPQPWNSFATLHVSDDCSILSIFSGGRMVQQRTINFGRALFLSKVTERLALQDMGRDVNTDSGRARLLHAANTLLANDHPTDEERQLLADSLDDSTYRMVSYITRTVNYHQRVEKGLPLEGLLVVASHGIEQALHTEIERSLGITSLPYLCPIARSADAEAAMRAITAQFKFAAMIDAIALGFADDERIPNLLETPDVRRTNRRYALVRKAAAITVGMLSGVLIAAGLYFAWGWNEASADAALKEKQLAAITKPLSPAMLRSEAAKLASLERDGAELLKKRRFAALMAQVAAIRGDDIFITGMTLTDAASAPDVRSNRRNNRNNDAASSGRHVLTISAELFQTPAERETALANFLNRLETSMKDAVITVRRDAGTSGGFPVVIRMEGSF